MKNSKKIVYVRKEKIKNDKVIKRLEEFKNYFKFMGDDIEDYIIKNKENKLNELDGILHVAVFDQILNKTEAVKYYKCCNRSVIDGDGNKCSFSLEIYFKNEESIEHEPSS